MKDVVLKIDGSHGEGGGQILRSALTLSMLTGQAIEINQIRAGRSRPGLMRQHLTAVRASAEISNAQMQGDALKSQSLHFVPGEIKGGDYHFEVGTAGSTMLVLQTILLALAHADETSRVVIEGGTHAMMAPPFDFISRVYLPMLGTLGVKATATLERYGFYPAGGGRVVVEVQPVHKLTHRLEWLSQPTPVKRTLTIVNAHLPSHVVTRETETFLELSGWPPESVDTRVNVEASCPGNVIMAELEFESHRELFTEIGQPGRPAEVVAGRCAASLEAFLSSGAAVDEYFCDQLLLPLSLAAGGHFTARCFSKHSQTQAWLIPQFLDVDIEVTPRDDESVEVRVERG